MLVVQVDQFTSTGNIRELDFDAVTLPDVVGGDSETARQLFGGSLRVRDVRPEDKPLIGHVWFKKGENGKCEFYKATYDTSD